MACDGDGKGISYKSKVGSITQFDTIGNDCEINTGRFLTACTEMASIHDDLGKAFVFPKKDMLGNIKKLKDKFETNPEKYSTLNKMMEDEARTKKNSPSTAVVGLLWLQRGLDFLCSFFSNLSQEFHDGIVEESMRPTVLKAYEATLKPYHGSMVQFMVTNSSRLIPYRSKFFTTLATDSSITPNMVISDIDEYLVNLSAVVDLIRSMLEEQNLNLTMTKTA